MGTSFYNVTGLEGRQRPLGYSININLTPRIYNLSLPFNITINQQQTRFTQPFSRFGISPKYKWVTLHGGHRNLYFSDFTLSGVTFLGGGIELNPGKFRFSAMYGQFRPAVDEANNIFQLPKFQRKGYSAKIGFGSVNNYLDLVYLQVEDDPSSLSVSDSLTSLLEKKSNTAVGIKSHLSFFKRKVYWDIDGGLSTVTENVNAPTTEEINALAPSFVNANISTHANIAGTTSLGFRRAKSSYSIEYRYVQDGYESLGLNYLLSDLQQISFKLQSQMFNNRMRFSGSYGLMYNNLSERLSAKTKRNIASVQLNYAASQKFNLTLNYANFSVVQQKIQDLIYHDTLLINQVNHTLNFSPIYTWVSKRSTQSIQGTFSFQKLSDNNEVTAAFSENNMKAAQVNYSYRSLLSGFGFRFGTNYNSFNTSLLQQTRYGWNSGISQSFLKKKMMVGLNGFYSIDDNEQKKGSVVSASLNLTYRPAAKHSFQLNYNWLKFDSQTSFTESRGSLSYRWSFRAKVKKKK